MASVIFVGIETALPSHAAPCGPMFWINALAAQEAFLIRRGSPPATPPASPTPRSRLMPTTTSYTPSRRSQNLRADGDLAVQIVHADAQLRQVLSQVLAMRLVSVVTSALTHRHARLISASRSSIWPFVGLTSDHRVEQAGRADHLLYDLLGVLALVRPRRGADIDDLVDAPRTLSRSGRLSSARQPETIPTSTCLRLRSPLYMPRTCAQRHVALVHEEQPVRREIVEQRPRRTQRAAKAARCSSRRRRNSPPHAASPGHSGALLDALRLQQLALRLEEIDLLLKLLFDVDQRFFQSLLRRLSKCLAG